MACAPLPISLTDTDDSLFLLSLCLYVSSFLLRYFVHTYENFKKDARHSKSRPYTIMRPEFLLVYLIHLLAHHPDYPTDADVAHYGIQSVFAPFQQMVLFVLEILTRGNQMGEDDAADEGSGKNVITFNS